MLKIQNLSFQYDKKGPRVLNEISLQAKKGELIGVLGTNGSGKTTLLKCIAGLLNTRDSIFIDNRDIADHSLKERGRKVAYVSQQSNKSCMTVFESILLGRLPHFQGSPTQKDHELTENLLNALDLQKLAWRKCVQLSEGEFQKVLLARSIIQEPEILLLDEPTNFLDIKNRIEVMKLFLELVKKQGVTSLVSLHDINLRTPSK